MTDMMTIADETVDAAEEMVDTLLSDGQDIPCHATYMVLDPLHLVLLREKIAKLSKRGTKKGMLPLTLWEAPEASWVDRARPNGTMASIRVRQVAVLGSIPDLGDWTFVATLHHRPSGCIVQRAWGRNDIGDETIAQYRARGTVCDHCEEKRARNETYVLHNRVTGETLALGSSCIGEYTGMAPDVAIYAFNLHAKITQIVKAHASLDDAPRAECGDPVSAVLAGLMGGDQEAADALVAEASRILLPSLVEERRIRLMADAGQPSDWNDSVSRLPTGLHNATVLLAEGYVSWSMRRELYPLISWYRAEADRLARERILADDVAQMAVLGLQVLPATPLALATLLADPAMQASARKLLALLAGSPAPAAPVSQGPARTVSAQFRSIGGGAWGAIILSGSVNAGDTITVAKRSGATTRVTLRDVVKRTREGEIWSLA